MRASFCGAAVVLSSSSRRPIVFGFSVFNLLFRRLAMHAKLNRNRLEELYRPKKERNFVFVVRLTNFAAASFEFSGSSGRPGWVMLPRLSIVFAKNFHIVSFVATPALWSSCSTRRNYSMWFAIDLEKRKTSSK